VTYTYDIPPSAPTGLASIPSSPANNNSPQLIGTAESGSTVRLYASADCSGIPAATGGAAAFNSTGLTVTVGNDSSTTFTATATAAGQSQCSEGFTYIEDSSAPGAPSIERSAPSSPAGNNSPKLLGSAEAGSIVTLYTSSDCTGPIAVQGTASAFSAPGLTVMVAADSTTTFKATATDAAGNASSCSSGFTYIACATGGCFTDQPLAAGVVIKVVHITELRARIDALRVRHALPQMAWTDPAIVAGVTVARAQHLIDLQTALAQAYQAAGRTPPAFTDAPITPSQTVIRHVHISELRSAVVALEGP
jgi:hypothetical protein